MKRFIVLSCLVLVGAGLVWVYDNYGGYVRDHYQRRKFPDLPRRDTKLSFSMDQQIASKKYEEMMKEVERVNAMLDEAEKQGYDIRYLRDKMPRVMRLSREGEYRFARMHLNSISLRVPRKREKVRLASGEESGDDYFPEPGSGRKVRIVK